MQPLHTTNPADEQCQTCELCGRECRTTEEQYVKGELLKVCGDCEYDLRTTWEEEEEYN